MAIHILGIRHHGPGSAKNVVEMLHSIQPDLILVEGPPELDDLIHWVGHPELKPPVAALAYNADNPQQASFYPFGEFSPEWQALLFAQKNKTVARMLDAPMATVFELANQHMKKTIAEAAKEDPSPEEIEATETIDSEVFFKPAFRNPLDYFAEIEGFENSEQWWEMRFEDAFEKGNAAEHFDAIMLIMKSLREAGLPSVLEEENIYREAYMRERIREGLREMRTEIVVVCGAWHAPALVDLDGQEKEDAKILKKMPKKTPKVGLTWVPWTYDRLSMQSGYGAGIQSPGWYEHQWRMPEDRGERWLVDVAKIFRKKDVDISTAHLIEANRLTEALTRLRGKRKPGLNELNEAVITTMCMGDAVQMQLIQEKLITGIKLGKTPDSMPKHPLQADFEQISSKLRFIMTAMPKEYALDLRKDLDLSRSIFFHRLKILEIQWASQTHLRSKGTFKEGWTIAWRPEMMVNLIEKGLHGNTIEAASNAVLVAEAEKTPSVSRVAELIETAIPAELFPAMARLLDRISTLSAVSADVMELMAALPPLVNIGRYGNVRNTDFEVIGDLVSGFVVRICVGLPNAAYGVDEQSAIRLFELISKVNDSMRLVDSEELQEMWRTCLASIPDAEGINPLILGCVARLLFDAQQLDVEEAARRLGLALSSAQEPTYAASWVEGFLSGSGMILVYDDKLWNLLYTWASGLERRMFLELLPLLRRTFSKFNPNERFQIGERAKKGLASEVKTELKITEKAVFFEEEAEMSLDFVKLMLNLS